MAKCKHGQGSFWNYEHTIYDEGFNKCTIRRWCPNCGKIEHTSTTGKWYYSTKHIGKNKMFDHYPENYPNKFKTEMIYDLE